MIGTPCVYKRAVLEHINFDEAITGPSDDTDLCYRLEKAGYKLGVGSALIKQVHRSSFGQFLKKWIWYGSGDAEFVRRHPNRFVSILYHQIGNYAIKKSLISVAKGKPKFILFFVSAGLLRTFGMSKSLLGMLFFGRSPKIYKT
jgi:GT2 family glycosyltransferase